MQKKYAMLIKWSSYFLLLLISVVLQTTPGVLAIFDVKPLLVIPLVVAISMFESEFLAGITGLVGGLFWDACTRLNIGVNSIVLMFCCMLCSLLVIYLMRKNMLSCLLLTIGVVVIDQMLFYFFHYILWGYEGSGLLFVKSILPSMGYTLLFVPIYFSIIKKLYFKIHQAIKE